MDRTIDVCFICDDGYIVPTTVAIATLLETKYRSTRLRIYIVAADLTEENEQHFRHFAANDVEVSVLRRSASGLSMLHAYSSKAMCVASPTALLKFSLGEILPHLDKVLYLDGDLLVRRDLSELFALDLGENLVAAVPDSGKMYSKRPIMHAVKSYFNSGVMLLNLAKMRSGGYAEKLFEAKRQSTDVSLMDQNIFNQLFDGYVCVLPIRYNCLYTNLVRAYADGRFKFDKIDVMYGVHYRNFVELREDAVILHFASKEKPWKYDRIPLLADWDRAFELAYPGQKFPSGRQHAEGKLATFRYGEWFDEELRTARGRISRLNSEVEQLRKRLAQLDGRIVGQRLRRAVAAMLRACHVR